MDPATEDSAQSDADPEMTVLTPEDITEQNLYVGDEVETLRNSLREAVHDDNVRPKMQCLMMDSSFSMVTMQGEDSGIAWETTPSRCTTPWMSEAGIPSVDLSSPAAVRPATPGSQPAGKIIFVMDEELISRRKKTKERLSGPKSKADRKQEVLAESSENISGRPELVEVSQPNVKTEGDQEDPTDPLEDKEQQLFSLVSEGSEILNIVVPPKLATVDEEVSKEMVDNLSYLEETLVPRANEETHENELLTSIEEIDDQVKHCPPVGLDSMDPPGAPVARMPTRGAVGNVDYFEAFALIDAQAPGGPAVAGEGQVEPETKTATESQGAEKPARPKDTAITKHVDTDKSDTISLEELTNELLDEVFYGGTDDYVPKSPGTTDGGGAGESVPSRLPSKPSGSNLFESQEDILTPIFLPEGPPKIIDPILLEEPKAMAFLYTDLYEEALGSWKKEEDTESVTSEKSFHSRHSDREARGYLEKYVLIDETPVVEVEPTDNEKRSEEDTRLMSQDFYDLGVFVNKPEKGEMPNSEEEITDFFRSSASSSPCGTEPFPRLLEEDDTQPATKSKTKTERSVSITAEKAAEIPVDQLSISSFEFPSEELEWASTDDHPTTLSESNASVQDLWKRDSEMNKPVAPPRRKVTSPPKASLDLTPLTPVDVITQENEEAGGKEQREEEKETASLAETADEGDGDGKENALAVTKTGAENMQEIDEVTAKPTEGRDAKTEEEERSETETVTEQTELETDVKSLETNQTENNAEKQEDTSTVLPTEQAKNKGQCSIL